MLRFALCDDEESERTALREIITGIPGYRRAADLRIVDYADGEGLLADIAEGFEWFDLVFLDVYMGGISGVETARRLRNTGNRTPLAFLTTSPNFGVEAFEVEAAGYLLKPVTEEKVAALLSRVLTPAATRPKITLQCGRERRYFNLNEILYAESFGHVTRLHLHTGETAVCREKLRDLETLLADQRFLRCHQSFLINMDYVADVQEGFRMENGVMIPIPVRRHREMVDIFYRFFVTAAVGRRSRKESEHV